MSAAAAAAAAITLPPGTSQTDDLEWKFVQSFGDDNSSDDDLVTAVEFDETGQYLAVGDKAGRICIFEGHAVTASPNSNKRPIIPLEYKFYTEFQSHEPEFDCLKSLEIEEKINMIKWAKKQNNGLFLLACNDKTIKFWKVHEKKIKRPTKIVSSSPAHSYNAPTILSSDAISIPHLIPHQTITTATPKRVYSNAHGYHINCFPAEDHQLLTERGFMLLDEVEAVLATEGSIRVACPRKDGSMEFHEVTRRELKVHDGVHQHVEMGMQPQPTTDGAEGAAINLTPTTNHRMWVRVGPKDELDRTQWTQMFAGDVASSAMQTNSQSPSFVQFQTNAPLGVAGDSPNSLPCISALNLTSVDQIDAFMELYGFWLLNGRVMEESVELSVKSHEECEYVQGLLERLSLPRLEVSTSGAYGYSRAITHDPDWRCTFSILSRQWVAFLRDETEEGVAENEQRLAPWILQQCSAQQLRCVLRGLSYASGEIPADQLKLNSNGSILTSPITLRDQLTVACLRAGYSTHFSLHTSDATSPLIPPPSCASCHPESPQQQWRVHFSSDPSSTTPTLPLIHSSMRRFSKPGRVWCVTVPTPEHLIIFRRILQRSKEDGVVTAASIPTIVCNSVSLNSDGETFISADDLRINLWNLNIANETFNVVDVKPPNLEELTEVITSATFHPQHCSQLIYSSSRGSIRLADLREAALCDQHAKLFEIEEDPSQKSFFSEIISSISDAHFIGPEGRYILSRDYLTLKVWDVNMENRPVSVIPIHDYLKVHLCDLYENDCIFDKFESAASADGSRYVTGSYNNHFVIHHVPSNSSITIEALKDPPRRKKKVSPISGRSSPPVGIGMTSKKDDNASNSPNNTNETTPDTPNVNLMDFGKKALHVSYHPSQHVIAIAGLNKLYIYQAINSGQ